MQITILLGTFNGEKFLTQQLESISRQTYKNWRLYVSDDGSNDSTISLLKKFQAKWGDKKLVILSGSQRGFAQNYLSLVERCDCKSDFFAFSDQDDLWLEDHLERGVKKISFGSAPKLHCSGTHKIDEKGIITHKSKDKKLKPSFANALTQCIAGGNTMIFNWKAFVLLRHCCPFKENIVSHDWLLYQLVTAAGGEAIFEPSPTVLYRQHTQNLLGENSSIPAKLIRLKKFVYGDFRRNNEKNLRLLKAVKKLITQENYEVLLKFDRCRASTLAAVAVLFSGPIFHRQSLFETFILWIGFFLKRV